MANVRYRPNKKGQRKLMDYISAYAKPSGRFWKRNANKKVRKANVLINGSSYKKNWGWFEWS